MFQGFLFAELSVTILNALRDALEASAAEDYVVRVVDGADPLDGDDETSLLAVAWLQLYLAVGEKPTSGPRARSLWLD